MKNKFHKNIIKYTENIAYIKRHIMPDEKIYKMM